MPCFPGSVGLLTVRPLSFLRNKVVSLRADDDSSTLTVRQILKKLLREQEIFAAAVKLLQETSGAMESITSNTGTTIQTKSQ
jgi:hypothetical protein